MQFNSYIISDTKTALSIPVGKEFLSTNFKSKAFTLAETLITLSIIGVVAAITVPTLMSNMNKQTYVTGLKKAYNQLQNAIKMLPVVDPSCYPSVNNCLDLSIDDKFGDDEKMNLQNASVQTFAQVFKHHKIGSTKEECGRALPYHGACVITNDGMIYSSYNNYGMTHLNVDINGTKGPNKIGRDIFTFVIENNKLRAAGDSYTIEYHSYTAPSTYEYCTTEYVNNDTSKGFYDSYCTGKVLREGKMDY